MHLIDSDWIIVSGNEVKAISYLPQPLAQVHEVSRVVETAPVIAPRITRANVPQTPPAAIVAKPARPRDKDVK